MLQRTLILIKPDGVRRGLIGRIISTFEDANLVITAMCMTTPSKDLAKKHYPDNDKWFSIVGNKTLEGYALIGMNAKAELGTENPIDIGKMVKGWLVDFISSGPVVAMIVEGNEAVRNGRRLCGNTVPLLAEPGSIRGRFCLDSPDLANSQKRPVFNVVHASGEVDEAEAEIALWFPEKKLGSGKQVE